MISYPSESRTPDCGLEVDFSPNAAAVTEIIGH
jgi:hypothetical protein